MFITFLPGLLDAGHSVLVVERGADHHETGVYHSLTRVPRFNGHYQFFVNPLVSCNWDSEPNPGTDHPISFGASAPNLAEPLLFVLGCLIAFLIGYSPISFCSLGLSNRTVNNVVGCGTGGSSSVNAALYSRPSYADIESWNVPG